MGRLSSPGTLKWEQKQARGHCFIGYMYAVVGWLTLNACCIWRKLRLKEPKQQKLNETYHLIPTQMHL